MKKYMFALTAVAVSFSAVGAQAGGFGKGGHSGYSSGLINVSPSIGIGDVSVLNGIGNGNAILSGNVVSGVLNGNDTGVLNGVLSGIGINTLNKSYKLKKH